MAQAGHSKADRFLFGTAIFALIYCVAGFGLRAATDPATQDRLSSPVIALAALMTAWLALFAWQVHLRQSGRIAQHMALGRAGAVVAAVLVPVGIYISLTAGREFESALFVLLNAFGFIGFAVLVALAIGAIARGNVDAHRRYMLVATLLFLGPATGRWLPMVGLPGILAPPILLGILVAVPLIYDRKAHTRWHPASKLASSVAVASILLGPAVSTTPVAAMIL